MVCCSLGSSLGETLAREPSQYNVSTPQGSNLGVELDSCYVAHMCVWTNVMSIDCYCCGIVVRRVFRFKAFFMESKVKSTTAGEKANHRA